MEEKISGRKRPDVVERIKAKKGKEEKVVKCALSNRLIEKSLINEIQKLTFSTNNVFIKQMCSKFYPTIMVDEYNTTKVCSDCDCRLYKVVNKKTRGFKKGYRFAMV